MKYWLMLGFCLFFTSLAPTYADDEIMSGQTIRISTHLQSYAGKPSWLLVIRDLDHDRTIPYVFDFQRGENVWVAYTFGHNYLITISNLQIPKYVASRNDYKNDEIKDFCHLQSNGHVERGVGMDVIITGKLSAHNYTCQIMRYPSN